MAQRVLEGMPALIEAQLVDVRGSGFAEGWDAHLMAVAERCGQAHASRRRSNPHQQPGSPAGSNGCVTRWRTPQRERAACRPVHGGLAAGSDRSRHGHALGHPVAQAARGAGMSAGAFCSLHWRLRLAGWFGRRRRGCGRRRGVRGRRSRAHHHRGPARATHRPRTALLTVDMPRRRPRGRHRAKPTRRPGRKAASLCWPP